MKTLCYIAGIITADALRDWWGPDKICILFFVGLVVVFTTSLKAYKK